MSAFSSESNMTHHKGGKARSGGKGMHLGNFGGKDPHAHPSHHKMNVAHGTRGGFAPPEQMQGGGAPQ